MTNKKNKATREFLRSFESTALMTIAKKINCYPNKASCIQAVIDAGLTVSDIWKLLSEDYKSKTTKVELKEYSVPVIRYQEGTIKVNALDYENAEEVVLFRIQSGENLDEFFESSEFDYEF